MNRRERLEAKLDKRQEWAEARKREAQQRFQASHAIVDQIPMGQPILIGHHSEKGHRAALARSDNHMRKGCEAEAMATHHESKAGGLERQLDNCIFSDDDNAIEAIEAKLATLEARRDRMKAINTAHTRFLKKPATLDTAELTEEEKEAVRTYTPPYSWMPHPFPPYSFQNLGGNIRRYKQRIEEIKKRNARSELAEASGGVAIEGTGDYIRVTFSEKPERDVLNALREAGFRWGGGSWTGRRDALPECIKQTPGCPRNRSVGLTRGIDHL